ncbi:MAG: cyclic nucleotide-binding domain-containing protein [Betaproteobacteria bacterium]|nr:cyclic nucleotide-binding domain-containing protein [Betaproteobacteria bacterium]MBI2510199.1 cyclic nucleotide-binding domain-containing protein [Betaproteobacteria bacterium]
MDSKTIAEFTARFPALADELGQAGLAKLLEATTSLELPDGRKVIRDRMPVDSLYMILDGKVSISVEANGRSIKLGELGPGEWLGEVSVLSGELLASSTVTTETPVRFLRLKHEKFEELIWKSEEISSVLLRQLVLMLADRLRKSGATLKEPLRIETIIAETADAAPAEGKPRNWLESFFGRPGGT